MKSPIKTDRDVPRIAQNIRESAGITEIQEYSFPDIGHGCEVPEARNRPSPALRS